MSLDFIEFKFRKWHCASSTGAKCTACEANYALTIDPVSGREYCKLSTVSNTCPLNEIKNIELNSCIA